MLEENFDLQPKKKSDDDIEYWVKGFIFGFIKYSERKYWYQDWANGKAMKDYWVAINKNSRDEAYDEFKRNIPSIRKQYDERFTERAKKEGEVAMKGLVEDVRENYFEKYSQCEVNLSTLQKKGYENVLLLLEEEVQYVKNEKKFSASTLL